MQFDDEFYDRYAVIAVAAAGHGRSASWSIVLRETSQFHPDWTIAEPLRRTIRLVVASMDVSI